MPFHQAELGTLVKAHYGKALKKENRDDAGVFDVYGSSGQVGFHIESICDYPTLVVGRKGSVGDIVWAPKGGWVIDTAYFLEILNPGILDLRYLFYALKRANLANKTITTSIPGLNRDDFYETKISLPPLAEQKRIAAILDKADSLRRKNQQAIHLADQFLRAVFLDMFGDPAANPKVWEKYAVGELGRVITGSTPPGSKDGMFGDDIPFITPGDLDSNVKQISRWLSLDGAGYSRVCRSGSLMACCIGATIGKVAMANRKSAFNQQINVVEWFDLIDDIFGYYFFKMNPRFITENAIKTTLPILKKSLFEQIEMPVPPIDMQRAFAKKVNAVWSLVDKQTRSLDLPLFDVLSQKAFAGEL